MTDKRGAAQILSSDAGAIRTLSDRSKGHLTLYMDPGNAFETDKAAQDPRGSPVARSYGKRPRFCPSFLSRPVLKALPSAFFFCFARGGAF